MTGEPSLSTRRAAVCSAGLVLVLACVVAGAGKPPEVNQVWNTLAGVLLCATALVYARPR
jgi:hypothetical protein